MTTDSMIVSNNATTVTTTTTTTMPQDMDNDEDHDATDVTLPPTKSFAPSANVGDSCLLLSICDDDDNNDDDLDDVVVVGQGRATEEAIDDGIDGEHSSDDRRNGGVFVCDERDCNYQGKSKKALNR